MSSLDSIAFSAYQLTDDDCQSVAWRNRVCWLQCSVVARHVGRGMPSLPQPQKMLSSLGQRASIHF